MTKRNRFLVRTAAGAICLAALLPYSLAQNAQHRGQRGGQEKMGVFAVGHYYNPENWSGRGQTFALGYKLDLDESRKAKLVVAPEGDRNEPTDRRDEAAHGTILEYLHSAHDVTQTGTWSQQGNVVTIHFDRIQYGSTDRPKSETLVGHFKGGVIFTTTWDKSFYGHAATLAFKKA